MEEEISLRELIEILIRGKWLIAGITLVAVLISGIFSFFIIPTTYEAGVTLVAPPLSVKNQQNSIIDTLLNFVSPFPQMTLETYRMQVTSPQILNQVKEELNLDPNKYTLESLRNSINLETVKNTNFIKITVKDSDPEMAAKIANAVASKFVDYVLNTLKEQMGKAAVFLENQMQEQEKNLKKVTEELKNFNAQPQDAIELQEDIESKLQLLSDFKARIEELEVTEKAIRSSLESIKSRLAGEPRYLELEKSIIDDPTVAGAAAGLIIKSQEVNQTYDALSQKVAELEAELAGIVSQKKAIENSIKKVQQELEGLQAAYVEKQTEYDLLQQKYNAALETYSNFLEKYEEMRITTAGNLSESNMMIVSPAVVPEKPVAPKKLLNITLAAVLGLMIGIFAAFFADYWKRSGMGDLTTPS